MSTDEEIAERILDKVQRFAEPVLSRPRPVIRHRIVAGMVLIVLAWGAVVWLSAPVWLLYVACFWAALIVASAIYLRMRLAKLTTALEALAAKAESFKPRDRNGNEMDP